jgi:hypothetical protein
VEVTNRSVSAHTSVHTGQERRTCWDSIREARRSGLGSPEAALHSVWGRVVLDIPAFCRELVAALAE